MIFRMFVALAVFLVSAARAGSQIAGAASLDRSLVRIQVAGRPMEQGRIVGMTADTLHYTARSDGTVRSIVIGEASEIWIGPKSTRLGRMAKFGTIGLLGGAAGGYALGSRSYHHPVTEPRTYDTFFFGPITLNECVAHCGDATPAMRGFEGALIGAATGILFSQTWDGPWKVLRFR